MGWHWLMKLNKFQVYKTNKFIIPLLYTVATGFHLKNQNNQEYNPDILSNLLKWDLVYNYQRFNNPSSNFIFLSITRVFDCSCASIKFNTHGSRNPKGLNYFSYIIMSYFSSKFTFPNLHSAASKPLSFILW